MTPSQPALAPGGSKPILTASAALRAMALAAGGGMLLAAWPSAGAARTRSIDPLSLSLVAAPYLAVALLARPARRWAAWLALLTGLAALLLLGSVAVMALFSLGYAMTASGVRAETATLRTALLLAVCHCGLLATALWALLQQRAGIQRAPRSEPVLACPACGNRYPSRYHFVRPEDPASACLPCDHAGREGP
jgi:hypothetical protein